MHREYVNICLCIYFPSREKVVVSCFERRSFVGEEKSLGVETYIRQLQIRMVSIRKRRHLGIQERYKILSQLSRFNAHQTIPEFKLEVIQIGRMDTSEVLIEKKPEILPQPSSSHVELRSSKERNDSSQGLAMKMRKSSRRKQAENQDSCMLRGVYYKNMKWQAAIKVEKKQIHLGTVATMEEAAHLYDRAAYLCGRVPNFELSEEEKHELHGLQWEEFLLMTKEAIASKKKRKRIETCMRKRHISAPGEDETPPFYCTAFHPPQGAVFHIQ
ncbi:hypothetical protein GOP47_0020972 [Adiantum capillus-veneris]|uniref:AP2/ERF domain-containing protein n=1 Tax=Adiantum capillus-veneris TaxID=13818 RepID=A0A9D4UAZ8_ADICA|nr:hypothetical protein GOP47_0020972 [Adiantum capillus-veneris]